MNMGVMKKTMKIGTEQLTKVESRKSIANMDADQWTKFPNLVMVTTTVDRALEIENEELENGNDNNEAEEQC
ncbi:BFH_collapsed_G0021120.mRNA.1.CDS.1 [Saccharomyces cerevisiae]|nr:BFH_collapsed_G0021120.mRNA.1.CDS.1 [Saccharomyces cerevisiae]